MNEKGLAITSQRSKPAADKVKAHHSVELTPGGKYELSSDITYNFEKNNINYLGDHLLKLHQQPDIKWVSDFLLHKKDIKYHLLCDYVTFSFHSE